MHSSFSAKSPAPLVFTHGDLQRNTQQFVDDINAKRKRDADSLIGYFLIYLTQNNELIQNNKTCSNFDLHRILYALIFCLDVRKALEMQATSTVNKIEETLVELYEANSKVIQDKLQEIFAVLDRICK